MNTMIKDVMSAQVHTINAKLDLQTAQDLMKKYKIRHLPVLEDKELIGVISERDIQIMQKNFHAMKDLKVEEVCSTDLYTTSADASLFDVSKHMAEEKIGSAVIVDENEHVIGIFTTTDALSALANSLSS